MATQNQLINVVALTEDARRDLTKIQKQQFPFALAKTLNQVSWGATERVRAKTRFTYNLHSNWIPKNVTTNAKISKVKRDVKIRGIGSTVVFTRDNISGFMPTHETGGTRLPSPVPAKTVGGGRDKGKAFTLPGRNTRVSLKTGSGRTKKRFHPRALLKDYKGQYRGGRTQFTKGGGKRKAFIVRARRGGNLLIVRRLTRKPLPLEVLWTFERKVSYRATWGFETIVRDHVDRKFKKLMDRNLKMAVATAR